MNQIILFVVFILFGVFIYYILKEQCKCDIVEGNFLDNISQFGSGVIDGAIRLVNPDTPKSEDQIAMEREWSCLTDNNCARERVETISDNVDDWFSNDCHRLLNTDEHDLTELCKISQHYINPENSCGQLLLRPLGTFMTALSCAGDLTDFTAHELGTKNPMPAILNRVMSNDYLNPEFLAYGITETVDHFNNSIQKGYDHSDGFCLKNEQGSDFNDDQKKECINVIASLSHEKNKQTPNTDKITSLTAECNRFNTCKKMFILPGPDGNRNCVDLDDNLRRLNCTNDAIDNYNASLPPLAPCQDDVSGLLQIVCPDADNCNYDSCESIVQGLRNQGLAMDSDGFHPCDYDLTPVYKLWSYCPSICRDDCSSPSSPS